MKTQISATAQQGLLNVSEIELVYKPNYKPSERPKITDSCDAYEVLIQNWNLNKIEFIEEFKIILLNRRSRVLGIVNISAGGVDSTTADAKVIFSIALKAGASGIILAHNHPSGELDPGPLDIAMTYKLQKAAELLDLKIMDHLIISKDDYYSFAERRKTWPQVN